MWLENIEGQSLQYALPTCEEHSITPTHILTLNGVVVCLCDDCSKELGDHIERVKKETFQKGTNK